MFDACGNVGLLIDVQVEDLVTARDPCGALNHDPVLGPVLVCLQRQLGAGLDGQLLDLETLARVEALAGTPGSVNLEVRVVPFAPARLQALHHLRHVLCPVLGRNQDRILRRDDQEVPYSDGGK